jgi:hypothetical protein
MEKMVDELSKNPRNKFMSVMQLWCCTCRLCGALVQISQGPFSALQKWQLIKRCRMRKAFQMSWNLLRWKCLTNMIQVPMVGNKMHQTVVPLPVLRQPYQPTLLYCEKVLANYDGFRFPLCFIFPSLPGPSVATLKSLFFRHKNDIATHQKTFWEFF